MELRGLSIEGIIQIRGGGKDIDSKTQILKGMKGRDKGSGCWPQKATEDVPGSWGF